MILVKLQTKSCLLVFIIIPKDPNLIYIINTLDIIKACVMHTGCNTKVLYYYLLY